MEAKLSAERPKGRSFGASLLLGKTEGVDDAIIQAQYSVEADAIVFRIPRQLAFSDIRKKEKRYDDDLGRWIKGGTRIVASYSKSPTDDPTITVTATPSEMIQYVEQLPDSEQVIADLTAAGLWPIKENWTFPMRLAAGMSLNLPMNTKGCKPAPVSHFAAQQAQTPAASAPAKADAKPDAKPSK